MQKFNIKDFGAKENTLCTKAIQAAVDEAYRHRGEVIIPEGVFLTGTVRLRSHVTLHLLRG